MDTTQDNEFLKSHPIENKTEVPQEIDKAADIFSRKYFSARPAIKDSFIAGYQLAQEQFAAKDKEIERLREIIGARDIKIKFDASAFRAQLEEIERLRGLIRDAFVEGQSGKNVTTWKQFTERNNL